jgi:hypothetical protein
MITQFEVAIALVPGPSVTEYPDYNTQIFIFYKFFLNRYQCQFHCKVTIHRYQSASVVLVPNGKAAIILLFKYHQ